MWPWMTPREAVVSLVCLVAFGFAMWVAWWSERQTGPKWNDDDEAEQ
jgi:hypothetical protein